MKDACRQTGKRQVSYTTNERIGCGEFTFLQGMVGFYQADYLTHADPVIPDWFKITFLGEVETIIMQSWLGGLEHSISDSILGLFSCF